MSAAALAQDIRSCSLNLINIKYIATNRSLR